MTGNGQLTTKNHMRYHFFLHYELFFQSLGKEAVQTNMHTTVNVELVIAIQIGCHGLTSKPTPKL